MTSHPPTARMRHSGRSQLRQHQQPVDAHSLFPSKAQLAAPSSSSSFLSAWEQHTAAPSSSTAVDDEVGSYEQSVDSVEVLVETPVGKHEKTGQLSESLLLRPPRRNNDPMFQYIPLRTHSTASSPPYPPQQQSTYSTLTSYASAPSKRQLDESFISSSQPLPSERWQEEEPRVHSPAATKQKTQHLAPPTAHPTAVSTIPPSPPLPHPTSNTVTEQPVIVTIPTDTTATAFTSPTTTAATTIPTTAPKLPVVDAAAEPPLPSLLSSLQSLSPHVYELSQYHMLLGVCLMRDGELESASEQFTLANQLFQPAIDLLPASAFAELKADMLTMRAKAASAAALTAQTGSEEKESESTKSEREERTRSGLEKARELYAAAINADEGRRGELWNDLCLFLLRVGDLQTAGQLLELLVGACGDCLDLFVNLGVLHTVYGDAEAASDYFQHVLIRSPQHVTALVNYASSLSTRQQHRAAVRILQLAHQLHPRSVLVLNNMAVEYALLGDQMAAAGWLQKADEVGYDSERVATVSLTFNTANTMLALACEQSDEEVRIKLLDGAHSLLTNELAKETKERESQIAVLLHMCRGDVCTEKLRLAQQSGDGDSVQKMFAAAESDYMAALTLQPDNSDAWVQMCGLYEQQHETSRAKEIYARLLETLTSTSTSLPASAVPLLNNLALLLMDDRQYAEAVEMLNVARRVLEPLVVQSEAAATPASPSSPVSPSSSSTPASQSAASTTPSLIGSSGSTQLASVLVNLSHCQQLLGELDAALKSLQYARQLRPAHLSTLAGLSSVYVQQGAWQEAEVVMEEAAGLVGDTGKRAEMELVKRNKRTLGVLKERTDEASAARSS